METNLQLTSDEKQILESIYGRQTFEGVAYNPRMLEAVKDLTAQEKKFFTGKNFVPSHFFVQTLYKVRGFVTPFKFTLAVNRMIADNENLRANFCNLGTRTVKVIRPSTSVKPEIIFRNFLNVKKKELDDEFRKVFEADARRIISLRQDPLIRFGVYKTGEKEFAVFVTMAQVISENFDAENFFCKLFDILAELKPKEIPDELPPKNYEAIREYWAKILDNAPPMSILPYEQNGDGTYRQGSFCATIPADILSDLRGHAQSNRLFLIAILQSAWGFMLQLTNKRRDSLFCQISSSENFSLNVIPVRLTSDDDSTVEQIVRKQFRQLIISQPYSLSDWSILDELTVQKKLFDHFISFKEFTNGELNYAKYTVTPADPRGKIIYQGSWSVQDMKLGLYFRYTEKNLYANFIYDAGSFSNNGVEELYKLYLVILQQMILDWEACYSDFIERLRKRFEVQLATKESTAEDERRKLRDLISQLPILQGRFGGTIALFERHAKLVKLYEGDRISSDDLEKNFVFVTDGIFSRNVDTGDGWYNTLDIIERNAFVNPTNFLEKQLFAISITVLTERAELLIIPHKVFIEILRNHSEVALSFINYALEQMERYQMLWIQT